MKKILTIIIFCQTMSIFAQNADFKWVRTAGNSTSDVALSIITDNSGDVISTGYFEKSLNFKKYNSNITLNSQSGVGYYDLFVLKTTNNGTIKWAKNIGGLNAAVFGSKIIVDSFDNIYIIGDFSNSIDFDPGNGIYTLTSVSINKSDIFILKLDSLGNFIWVKSIGGYEYDFAKSIQIDKSNSNIYIAGNFSNSVDFDPGNQVELHNSRGELDAFLLKLTTQGNFIWVKTFGGKVNDYLSDISISKENEIYITGHFNDTAYIEDKLHKLYKNNLGAFGFLIKFNKDGKYLWGQHIADGQCYGVCVSNDASGSIYLGGYFYGFTKFYENSTSGDKYSKGGSDIFIKKMNKDGGFLWVKTFEGDLSENIREMHVSANGNVYSYNVFANSYSTNIYYNKVDFDPSNKVYLITNKGPSCAVISKLDSSGSFKWAKAIGGEYSTITPFDITQDNRGNIFSCGSYGDIVDFNPDTSIVNDTSKGAYDIYIHKLGTCENSINTFHVNLPNNSNYIFNNRILNQSGIYKDTFKSLFGCDSIIVLDLILNNKNLNPFILYPNPIQNNLQVSFNDTINVLKYKVYDVIAQLLNEGLVMNTNELSLNFETYTKGIYLMVLEINEKSYCIKFLKI